MSVWKGSGDEVVFTNGCFDILHLGHVDYLEKARALGDRLVVALNTDNSVKRLKGEERPLNNELSRARLIAALEFVDAVVYFSEDTPQNVIETLIPDILVKGNDYLAENIVGAEFVIKNGGRVETVPLVDGYSTTNLVEKIKTLNK
ncbi:D-glycero-beta-D-manno-heptose 1-phosphate adenylyltransferase [Fulvivirga lutea]|uniref:D-glycero-beta-D-manno-heptose 1-phosphate adenylyltransferase n=1 Tax=Fulvivirga lutea TaxID=2810512 RepID=A0A974WIU4_9BACT|nr:D-glycero-beta-D-manno-heptose 1-phosphate adenylyltransferase [Fulvivirga lutea]QSE99343.1 D-glycero-beta-D-manno-heptose 1-phosphate adenylyltransferase [Fulvivirga lutea]